MTTKPIRRTCSNTFSSIMLVTKLRCKLSLRLTLKRTIKEFSHKKITINKIKKKSRQLASFIMLVAELKR